VRPPRPDPVSTLQHQMWKAVTDRFSTCQGSHGLTQADLSRALAVPRSQISAWFRNPDKITLKGAARLLGAMDAELIVMLKQPGLEP
jgi:hypothetical protein